MLKGLRLALPRTLVRDGMDDTVADAFDAACKLLSAAGATIVEVEVPEFAEVAHINRHGGFTAAEAWAWHERLVEAQGEGYDPRVVSRIRRGASMTAAQFIELVSERQRWIAAVGRRLREATAAAFVCPTVPVVAPVISELRDSDEVYGRTNLLVLRNPTLFNFLDGCALSLPCHREGDAPVGLMLAASGGEDARLLALGAAVEAVLQAR